MALLVDKYRPTTLEKLEIHQRINNRLKKMVEGGDMPHMLFYGPNGAGKKKGRRKMALLVDKYRPTTLEKLEIHQRINNRLKKMVEGGDMPHMLFYGPNGAGKKTRIMALLRDLYGPSAEKLRVEHKTFEHQTSSKKIMVECAVVSSVHHIELTPADAGIRDHIVVQRMIKETASVVPLDANGKRHFKIVVLNEVERLTKQAQHALRRTMEKYSAACRLILCCNDSSKVIGPLRSRCLLIRVPSPSDAEIVTVLKKVSKKAGFVLPEEMAERIAEQSEGNLRRALLCLETTKVEKYPFTPDQAPFKPAWQTFIQQIAMHIISKQSAQGLVETRAMFNELITRCVPASLILKTLLVELIPRLDCQIKADVVRSAAFYEHRMHLGTKEIFHLEGFVDEFMFIYNEFIVSLGQDFA
eukprot:TRINITY_DN6322_c0_g1_i1.p1 TRINITY_DN6322_c0_g1~~TRINITY_DN6322_c0_g1_i1.p1  ORF type:complete len:425 (-),score=133.66 TRINITY_DN6322_c0_g1_i1:65-1303(-)